MSSTLAPKSPFVFLALAVDPSNPRAVIIPNFYQLLAAHRAWSRQINGSASDDEEERETEEETEEEEMMEEDLASSDDDEEMDSEGDGDFDYTTDGDDVTEGMSIAEIIEKESRADTKAMMMAFVEMHKNGI